MLLFIVYFIYLPHKLFDLVANIGIIRENTCSGKDMATMGNLQSIDIV